LYQRTWISSNKQKYNILANHFKKVLEKYKSETFANVLSNLSSKDGGFWRVTKKICKHKSANLPMAVMLFLTPTKLNIMIKVKK